MTADYNGWQDEHEDEREARWRGDQHPDESELDPYDGWPEEMAGPEYWLNKKSDEDQEC